MAPKNAGKQRAKPTAKNAWNDNRGLTAAERKAAKALQPADAPPSIDDKPFRWSAEAIDHEYEGSWDWHLSPKETQELLVLLSDLSQKTWGQVRGLTIGSGHHAHHSQQTATLCQEARRRLTTLQYGDQEELFRLRYGARLRIWGVIDGSIFRIIWYDRDHAVYPTKAG